MLHFHLDMKIYELSLTLESVYRKENRKCQKLRRPRATNEKGLWDDVERMKKKHENMIKLLLLTLLYGSLCITREERPFNDEWTGWRRAGSLSQGLNIL